MTTTHCTACSTKSPIWLLDDDGSQFIIQDGTVYRPKEEHKRIQEACDLIGEDFSEEVFSSNSLNFLCAKKRNGWKPTTTFNCQRLRRTRPRRPLEHRLRLHEIRLPGHEALLPRRLQRPGRLLCSEYYQAFGHPDAQFFRVALGGQFPFNEKFTGFVKVSKWKLAPDLHPIFYAWYGRHLQEKTVAAHTPAEIPSQTTTSLLTARHEAILCHSIWTQWLPTDNHESRIVIGKFTQGAKNGEQHLQRRIVTDQEELNFLVKRAHEKGTLVRAEKTGSCVENFDAGEMHRESSYWILVFYHDIKAQYYHLRASMLCYAHINLLSMLLRFNPEDVPRVATDSLYLRPQVAQKCPLVVPADEAQSGQWRIKDEEIRDYRPRLHYEYHQRAKTNTPLGHYPPSPTP